MKGPAKLGAVIIGPHGPLTNWVFDIATRLALADPRRPVRKIDRNDGIEGLTYKRPIYLTNYPSPAVVAAIEAGDLSVIFVTEDPRDVLGWQSRALGLPMLESIRAQTASAVANRVVAQSDDVLMIDRLMARNGLSIVERIASALALPLSDDVQSMIETGEGGDTPGLEAILAARGDCYAPPYETVPNQGFLRQDAAQIASSVLDPLIAMARGDAVRPVIWPTAVFTFSASPGGPVPPVADVAGPPRTIYYGPYFYLPPARYRVEAILNFSEDIQDLPFVLDIYGHTPLASARIERRRAGGYRGYFLFDHVDPSPTLGDQVA